MSNRIFVTLFIIGLFIGCAPNHTAQPLRLNSTETSTPVAASESATPETMPTASSGLSSKVAAFYYPWYGNPSVDGQWIHWTENNHFPSGDIAGDYYPALGAYSSNDPEVVAQHMKWLQQAGIGVIITSWWGKL